jgi:SNF family Na+-dependent transporter
VSTLSIGRCIVVNLSSYIETRLSILGTAIIVHSSDALQSLGANVEAFKGLVKQSIGSFGSAAAHVSETRHAANGRIIAMNVVVAAPCAVVRTLIVGCTMMASTLEATDRL